MSVTLPLTIAALSALAVPGIPSAAPVPDAVTRSTSIVSCATESGSYRGSARVEVTQTGSTVTARVTGYQMGKNDRSKANVNVRLFANNSTYSGYSADNKKMDDQWRDEAVVSKATTRTNDKPVSASVEFVFDAPVVADPECSTQSVAL